MAVFFPMLSPNIYLQYLRKYLTNLLPGNQIIGGSGCVFKGCIFQGSHNTLRKIEVRPFLALISVTSIYVIMYVQLGLIIK